jgi:hypothetical protein
MRLSIPALAAVSLLVATPADAPAQGLGPILGPLAAPVDSLLRRGARGVRRVLRPPVYRPRVRAIRTPSASRRAVAQTPESLQQALTQGQNAQPKPFWPDASQDLFDYVLAAKPIGLWAHGYGAIVVSMFEQPPKAGGERSASAADSDNDRQTTGAAAGDETVCAESSADRAEAVTKQLADKLALASDQQAMLEELRTALHAVDGDIRAACPRGTPATLPERLRIMQDRLWALRVTAVNLRAPLQKFQDALTPEQRAKLGEPQTAARENQQSAAGDEGAAQQCYTLTQMAPQWPAEKMTRVLRLNKEQQADLGALNKTSMQMGKLMMGSCPQQAPATPAARLNDTLDWLDSMLFVGAHLAVAVDTFYGDLSDEQKAKLDKFDL